MVARGKKAGILVSAALGAVLATSGCFLAAAGAGAGGAIYMTDNGAEALVGAPVDQTFTAAQETFRDLGITESKTVTERDGEESRKLEGTTSDRDVSVEIRTQGSNTKVSVEVKKSPVTWDKDFAREILNRIVNEVK
jgi:hypothetical protein